MAVWEGTTGAGAPLSVTLTATDCSDGMSSRTYPLTAMVPCSLGWPWGARCSGRSTPE